MRWRRRRRHAWLLGDPGGAYALAERTLDAIGASGTAPVTLRRAMAYAARALDDRPLAMRLFADVSARARERGLVGLAVEADVSRAQLMADDVGLEPAIELAESARREAAAAGSAVNEVWAQSFLALFHLRQDTPSGFAEVHAALEAARRIDYPAAISLNLRSLAWGSIRAGRPRDAAEALTELFDGIVARDGVSAAGGALHTTVELLREIGSPAWAGPRRDGRDAPDHWADRGHDRQAGGEASGRWRSAVEPAGRHRAGPPRAARLPR